MGGERLIDMFHSRAGEKVRAVAYHQGSVEAGWDLQLKG